MAAKNNYKCICLLRLITESISHIYYATEEQGSSEIYIFGNNTQECFCIPVKNIRYVNSLVTAIYFRLTHSYHR